MTNSARIIPAHRRVYEFIVAYKQAHDGNSPTIREIGAACGISSTSVVVYWLQRLQRDGLIHRPEPQIGNRYASKIELVGGQWGLDTNLTPLGSTRPANKEA